MKYTTIRISIKDKERLKRLAKLLGTEKIIEALRYAIDTAEEKLGRYNTDLDKVLATLSYAKDIGETNAEKVDKYLYGEEK
ncbi:MAG: hypothetical protein NDF54_07010 [archaeon GB-1867-035]|nr:hypothetical protein [Candidatus Culexmicrobium profundum]